ncbi:MAG: hypothetical protein JSU63_18610 [Phycisphaerales bacterium]|nr:MAG: hypothetical protein JSU63_18610 [Phycisphaerales bacterium]
MNRRFPNRLVELAERRSALIAGTCIAIVLLAGIAYSVLLGDKLRYPDESAYCTLSDHLLSEHVYSFDGEHATAFMPPGYPFVLAGLRVLGGDITAFRIVNFFLLGACMCLMYRILAEHSAQLSALLGVALVMAYPVLFYTAGTLYAQTLVSCLLLIVVYLSLRPRPSWFLAIGRGALMGLMVLTVPVYIIVLAAVAGWHGLNFKSRGSLKLAVSLAIAAVMVGSWSIRNFAAFHAFVPVSTNAGMNLLRGNSEHTTPNTGVNVPIDEYLREAEGLSEVEQDNFFRGRAWRFVRENKGNALRLYCLKFLNYFNYTNKLYAASEASSLKDMIMLVTYGPLLLLLMVRLALFKKVRIQSWEWLLLSTYVLSGLAYAAFFTRIRFRVPFDLMLICLVAAFVGALAHKRWGKGSSAVEGR